MPPRKTMLFSFAHHLKQGSSVELVGTSMKSLGHYELTKGLKTKVATKLLEKASNL
jgi:hypothetical protein